MGSISPTFAADFFAHTVWEASFGECHLANCAQIWRMAHHKLSAQCTVLKWQNVSEIEGEFFAKHCSSEVFTKRKKFGEINLRSHFTTCFLPRVFEKTFEAATIVRASSAWHVSSVGFWGDSSEGGKFIVDVVINVDSLTINVDNARLTSTNKKWMK